MYSPSRGLGGMIGLSFVLHLVLFFVLAYLGPGGRLRIEPPVYYVDILDLPTTAPLEGHTASQAAAPASSPTPVATPQILPSPPAKTAPAMALPAARPSAAPSPSEEKAFEERMAKLQQNQDARHQEEALNAIRARLAAAGTASKGGRGSPTGSGSDYPSYLQSRLREAFEMTIASRTRNPEALVELTVDPKGRLTGYRLEKSSGDRLFEDAVSKAVTLAARYFPPPPDGKEFRYRYRFRPEGVLNR